MRSAVVPLLVLLLVAGAAGAVPNGREAAPHEAVPPNGQEAAPHGGSGVVRSRLVRPVLLDWHFDRLPTPKLRRTVDDSESLAHLSRHPALEGTHADALELRVEVDGERFDLSLTRNSLLLRGGALEGKVEECLYHGRVSWFRAEGDAAEVGEEASAWTCADHIRAAFRVGHRLYYLDAPADGPNGHHPAVHRLTEVDPALHGVDPRQTCGGALIQERADRREPSGTVTTPSGTTTTTTKSRSQFRGLSRPRAPTATYARPPHFHPLLDDASFTSVVEFVLVTDRSMHVRYTGQSPTLQQHVLMLLNHMDRLVHLLGFGVRLLVRSHEDWDTNLVSLSGGSDVMLANLRGWGRLQQGTTLSHDAMMMVGAWVSPVGQAYSPTDFCGNGASYALVRDWNVLDAGGPRDFATTAVAMAHEFGHNLGASQHDDAILACNGTNFDSHNIMNAGVSDQGYLWSTCAKAQIGPVLAGASSCLCRTCLAQPTQFVCGEGYYSDSTTTNLASRCKPCDNSCVECNAEFSCTRCPQSANKLGCRCVASCPTGTYRVAADPTVPFANAQAGNECRLCSSASLTCPAGSFLSCSPSGGSPFACVNGTASPADTIAGQNCAVADENTPRSTVNGAFDSAAGSSDDGAVLAAAAGGSAAAVVVGAAVAFAVVRWRKTRSGAAGAPKKPKKNAAQTSSSSQLSTVPLSSVKTAAGPRGQPYLHQSSQSSISAAGIAREGDKEEKSETAGPPGGSRRQLLRPAGVREDLPTVVEGPRLPPRAPPRPSPPPPVHAAAATTKGSPAAAGAAEGAPAASVHAGALPPARSSGPKHAQPAKGTAAAKSGVAEPARDPHAAPWSSKNLRPVGAGSSAAPSRAHGAAGTSSAPSQLHKSASGSSSNSNSKPKSSKEGHGHAPEAAAGRGLRAQPVAAHAAGHGHGAATSKAPGREHAAAPAPPAASSPARGRWEEFWDADHQHAYWFNHETGESSWDKPGDA